MHAIAQRKNRLVVHKLLSQHTALRAVKAMGTTHFVIHAVLSWLDIVVGIRIPLALRCVVPRGLPSTAVVTTALLGSVQNSTAELLRARIEVASLSPGDMLELATVTVPPREVSIMVASMFMLLGEQPSWPKAQVLLLKPDLPDLLLVLHPGDVEVTRLEDVVSVTKQVNFEKMGEDHAMPVRACALAVCVCGGGVAVACAPSRCFVRSFAAAAAVASAGCPHHLEVAGGVCRGGGQGRAAPAA